MELHNLRKEYDRPPIDVESVDASPLRQFEKWFGEARQSAIAEPNAMVISTVNDHRCPTSRSVLLKLFDESGFVFFTNYASRKAGQIESNPNVALLFPWYELQRQVEINGVAERISTAESIKYFALRPRGSQLGAWVSQQSAVISGRSLLRNKLAQLKKKFSSGEVPMPSGWGGFRVRPTRIEFWQGGRDRLHDRIEYSRSDTDQPKWHIQRLAP